MNLRLPTRFVLLDKAIATLGSVGVELYPDFNVFEVAKPYARDLMIDRYTPRADRRARARRRGARADRPRRAVPVHDILEQCATGRSRSASSTRASTSSWHKLDVVFNRLVIALVVAGGLIGSSLIGIFAKSGPHLLGLHVISLAGFVMSGVLGVWLMIGVIRSGRL
jgi:ubiquinone biosynthesis protein